MATSGLDDESTGCRLSSLYRRSTTIARSLAPLFLLCAVTLLAASPTATAAPASPPSNSPTREQHFLGWVYQPDDEPNIPPLLNSPPTAHFPPPPTNQVDIVTTSPATGGHTNSTPDENNKADPNLNPATNTTYRDPNTNPLPDAGLDSDPDTDTDMIHLHTHDPQFHPFSLPPTRLRTITTRTIAQSHGPTQTPPFPTSLYDSPGHAIASGLFVGVAGTGILWVVGFLVKIYMTWIWRGVAGVWRGLHRQGQQGRVEIGNGVGVGVGVTGRVQGGAFGIGPVWGGFIGF